MNEYHDDMTAGDWLVLVVGVALVVAGLWGLGSMICRALPAVGKPDPEEARFTEVCAKTGGTAVWNHRQYVCLK